MGGGAKFDYPKYVWSPAGGWWASPRNWKGNTMMAGAAAFALCIPVFLMSAERERRPRPPTRHIPSQRWAKHAAEDDPRLAQAAPAPSH